MIDGFGSAADFVAAVEVAGGEGLPSGGDDATTVVGGRVSRNNSPPLTFCGNASIANKLRPPPNNNNFINDTRQKHSRYEFEGSINYAFRQRYYRRPGATRRAGLCRNVVDIYFKLVASTKNASRFGANSGLSRYMSPVTSQKTSSHHDSSKNNRTSTNKRRNHMGLLFLRL
jgi:hypothetical protein